MQFSNKIKAQKKDVEAVGEVQVDHEHMHTEAYRGQILEIDDGDDSQAGGEGWHVGKLKFRKHIDDVYRLGSDGKTPQDYTVIDPQKPLRLGLYRSGSAPHSSH
jgi:hypothetical protein